MKRRLLAGAGLVGLAAGLGSLGAAQATEGYFLGGYGVIQSSLSGAGAANSEDAMSISLNPAGIAGMDRQFQIGVSLFMPERSYSTNGMTALIAPGGATSGLNVFPMPNMAYVQPIDASTSWGVAFYGNGGMNTDFPNVANPNCAALGGGSGVFCGSKKTGVNLSQAFLQFDIAKRFGNVAIGISPVIAGQLFSAGGLSLFDNPGYTTSVGNVTNRSDDFAPGVGLHAGLQWWATPQFRVGLSGASETYMAKLSKYEGLFAQQGSFNIPAWIDAGLAYDVSPALTLMGDYKRIFYSAVPAIANSSLIAPPAVILGADNGPGFGWRDVDVLAFGAEFKASSVLTLRAGAEFNTNPVRSQDVTLNILAPGVTTSQFSAGLSYKLSPQSTLDLAGYIAPKNSVSGSESLPPPFPAALPGVIKISLSEASVMAGWTYHFDAH